MARRPTSGDYAADSGYYDHHPAFALSRPVALIGFPGVEYRQVGHDLASLTGLPLVDLDRWIEHQAGQSLWQLLRDQGTVALRHLETQLLEKALISRPHGLIVLGDGVLIDAENLKRVRGTAAVIYFRLPPATAYWELRRQLREQPPGPSPFLPVPLESSAQLEPLWVERRPGFESAHLVVDMEGKRPEDVVPTLFEALPRLAGASVNELEDLGHSD